MRALKSPFWLWFSCLEFLIITCLASVGFAANSPTTGYFDGFTLAAGQTYYYGDVTLSMQADGNLVLYHVGYPNSTVAWAASYSPAGNINGGAPGSMSCASCYAVMQSDGDLVLYTGGNTPYWYTATGGNPGAHLQLFPVSPFLEILNGSTLLWQAGFTVSQQNGNFPPFTLFAGQNITIGALMLKMQTDGNLVAYLNSVPVWYSAQDPGLGGQVGGGRNCPECRAVFQTDGNLVLYDSGVAYWDSATNAPLNTARLLLSQSSPYIEIQSGTNLLWEDGISFSALSGNLPPFVLYAGQFIQSGGFTLSMQTDGNLIEYSGNAIVWAASYTPGLNGQPVGGRACAGCWMSMQTNGDLVLYSPTGAYWASNTGAHTGYRLALTGSGVIPFQGGAGCTNANAVNYNPAASIDNGTCVTSLKANPAFSQSIALPGVAISGGELNGSKINASYGKDYVYPTTAEIDYFAAKGMKILRIPTRISRLQPTNNGALSTTELALLDKDVAYAASKGLMVVIEPHDYGYMYDNNHVSRPIGTDPLMPDSYFANFWSLMAKHYLGKSNVVFGLMNEPHTQTPQVWHDAAVGAVNAIRATGATQKVLIPGVGWSGAHVWVSAGNGAVWAGYSDANFAYDVHNYLDEDSSGTHTTCGYEYGTLELGEFTAWARAQGVKGFLGEVGWSTDSSCAPESVGFMSYMSANSDVWMGYAYWAAGQWEGSYMYSIEPLGLGTSTVTDRPPMAVLLQHM